MSPGAIRKLNKAHGGALSLGLVKVPMSKSIANRALILAALAKGRSAIKGFHPALQTDDIRLMFNALCAMNASLTIQGGDLHISGGSFNTPPNPIQAGEAGTVLRFMLPLAALRCPGRVNFCGEKRLFERPLKPLLDALSNMGALWRLEKNELLLIPPEARPDAVDLEIDGALSSQFISGMALAMAGLPGGGVLRWTAPPASLGYISLTKIWLERFGCQARLFDRRFEISGGPLKPISAPIPGDWSAGAVFFCASAILGQKVSVFPLNPLDGQPDAAILPILGKAGSSWNFEGDVCHFSGCLNKGIEADLFNCPDLAPVLAAAAVFAPGVSELNGLNTLPHKESDRLQGIIRLVEWLGGRVERLDFALRIHPAASSRCHKDEPFDTMGDHRLAFAAALGGARRGGAVLNPGCVSKSFPDFWEAFDDAINPV